MENPWTRLREHQPFVLPMDAAVVERYNSRRREEKNLIHTELLPDPFAGRVGSPLVVLLSHSGYHPGDVGLLASNPAFQRAVFDNLRHVPSEWPLYSLAPAFRGTPPADWWMSRLAALIERVGASRVARNTLVLHASPYHQKEAAKLPLFPSSEYSRQLLSQHIVSGALVVGLVGRPHWDAYTGVDVAWGRNPRRPYFSPGNLGSAVFEEAVGLLRAAQ